MFLIASCIIAGGALGNLIDRIFRGFVVDYIYISFFPAVFNFADMTISIGALVLAVRTCSHKQRTENKSNKNEKDIYYYSEQKHYGIS